MTDTGPDPRDASPDTGKTRAVPPLAWIIGAILLALIVIGAVQYGGVLVTPHGGSAPVQAGASSDAVMPPAAPE